jgi:hypothetical protein
MLQFGGALNAISGVPGSCTLNTATVNERTRIGDVAVTPFSGVFRCSRMHTDNVQLRLLKGSVVSKRGLAAVNWQCKLATWTEQCDMFPNICTYPVEEAGPTVT